MRSLAVIGSLSRDVVADGSPRIGGGSWHAARALRALRLGATIFAKCGDAERRDYQRLLTSTGLPTTLSSGGTTTGFSMSYDEHGIRTMLIDALGEPWHEREASPDLLRTVEWLHVAPLLRSDFDAATLAAARKREAHPLRRAGSRARARGRPARARRGLRPRAAPPHLDPEAGRGRGTRHHRRRRARVARVARRSGDRRHIRTRGIARARARHGDTCARACRARRSDRRRRRLRRRVSRRHAPTVTRRCPRHAAPPRSSPHSSQERAR